MDRPVLARWQHVDIAQLRSMFAEPCFTAPVSDDPMLANVRDWLNRGGYVLEMLVAQKLAKRTNYWP